MVPEFQGRRMIQRLSPGSEAALAGRAVPRPSRPYGGGKSSLLATIMVSALIVFMIVPEGFNYDRDVGTGMPTEGSPVSRIVWLTLLAFGFITVMRKPGQTKALLREINPFYLAFIALAALSVLWSFDPGVSLRRFIRALTFFLDSMALALLAWRTTRFQSVVRPVLTIMLVGSIVFGIVSPKLAIEQRAQAELVGAWHGLAMQKNGLGSIGGLGLLFWVHAFLARESKLWAVLMGGGASLACLLLSRSSTSLMAALFACVLLLMLLRSPPALRRYMPYLIGLFVVTLLLYSLAVLNLVPGLGFVLKPIVMITGKDQTFSGRTAIWAIINEHIAYSPILGSGYGAYWTGAIPTSPSYVMLQRLYFYPTEGHNGYLDVINDLGAVGAFCLLAYLLTYLRQGLRLFATVRTQGALYLALLFLQLIANLSESRWFNVLSVEFVIMSLATVSMGRLLLQQKLDRRQQRAAAHHKR
jgi:exopolysaccharide production protein ExoQ